MKRVLMIGAFLLTLALVIALGYVWRREAPPETLLLATTTSFYDTGLLRYLEPIFEEKYNVDLRIISAGTGIAIRFAQRGDVDILLVHDRRREDKFVEGGYGVNRRCVAYNYFLIVGPAADPAGIKGLNPEEAFRKIMKAEDPESKFVSRGDDSGTHAREKLIWKSAGYDYENVRNAAWYLEAGAGMGATLMMAGEKSAYTVVDRGTFLAFAGEVDLVPLVEEGKVLLNPYGVIAVNPQRHPHVSFEKANDFINFLMVDETQKVIAEFGMDEYGSPLFYPAAGGKCQNIGCPTASECAKPAR